MNFFNAVLSYGCGIGSTALLVAICNDEVKGVAPSSTLVVFADTGAERPSTYEYLPIIRKYCRQNRVRFEIVRAAHSLEEYVLKTGILPSRRMRWCTQVLKIRPIRQRAKRSDVSKPYIQMIGFDASEKNRVYSRSLFRDCVETYPLIELGWNRQKCASAILDAGLPLPEKSACFCCPLQRLSTFVSGMKQYPDLMARVRTIEEIANLNRDGKRPFYLFREPVEQLLVRSEDIMRRAAQRGMLLDNFGMPIATM